jgi:hypothetical protein
VKAHDCETCQVKGCKDCVSCEQQARLMALVKTVRIAPGAKAEALKVLAKQ